ncbi:hypothetical protein AYO21_01604 [Fonsecaea monophora]|uniref:FAS1 domain-containing protein n=1 Tax=Fonsecaea monophora TaxID=254056 RepID=A0A177FIY6_9EURO|nr:hypothetical protein AYO21_01604 [Fonsecaea monophora]KAH0845135.1 hypothetical protein FOPE_09609 [Fonsecaea pedrosoi]OAG44147.1 hypothetical protein AYO21_01604 [Fonsecaea monophora]
MFEHILAIFVWCCALAATAATAEETEKSILETIKSTPELSSLAARLDEFPSFTSLLEREQITLLAPDNAALSATAENITTESFWQYHVLDGSFPTFPTNWTRYLPSMLQVDGSTEFVVAQTSLLSGTTTFWSGAQRTSYTTGNVTSCSNGVIHVIQRALALPRNFSSTYAQSVLIKNPSPFSTTNTSGAVVEDVNVNVVKNGSIEIKSIDSLSGITVFLPITYAFQAIGSVASTWTLEELRRIMSYHVVDEVLTPDAKGNLPRGEYSTLETSKQVVISSVGDVQFVNSARIVGKYNWVFEGGTIYTIFGVLNPDNTTVAPNASDSGVAFAGASFTTDVSFPITSTSSTNSSSSSSGGLSIGAKAAIGVGAVVFAIIATLLGFWIFHRGCSRQRASIKYEDGGYQLSDMSMSQKNLTSHPGTIGRGV